MTRLKLRCATLMLAVAASASYVAAADDDRAATERLFAARVFPTLQAKCFGCHGEKADDAGGGLDLRTATGALHGGESGRPALVAGRPDESPMYLAATRTNDDWSAMPPKENDELTAEQIADVRRWIAGGAPWPAAERLAELAKDTRWDAAEGVVVKTSGGLSPAWSDRRYKAEGLWAYQPVKKPRVPTAEPAVAAQSKTAVDAFLAVTQKKLGVTPAEAADRRTLVRRATFDLLGLPPTIEETEAFVADADPLDRAFARVVERLLASPHYGEQMARRWLDVVRYADSSGFANDYERGGAWRYRDYVVRAFNADKPFDAFVREQIAGDEINPDDPELLTAVGFLRMGPWELTAMEVPKVARQRFLDDVTNSVGETFLAHSLQCARCHDHKFDPIPTRDYYSLQACFATTQLVERPAAFLPQENTRDGFVDRKYLEQRIERHRQELARISELSVAAARKWYADERRDPAEFERALRDAADRSNGGKKNRPDYDRARTLMLERNIPEAEIPPRMAGLEPADIGRERIARKGLERLLWELDRYAPTALSVYDGPTPTTTAVTSPPRMPKPAAMKGSTDATHILTGGDPFSPSQPVEPGVLSVVAVACAAEIPAATAGRRRALAEWIADARNPLTPRVAVNRLWQWHFGRGLAGNPNNFGSTGKAPTHPELLDWLAAEFVEHDWSIKHLHRMLMNTEAYRRSCAIDDRAALAKQDPQGISYAVFAPRHLTAEELRDGLLRISGELNPTLGGVPVRPEINLEAALQPRQVMGTFASAWTPSPKPADRRRRSIYALKLRGLRDPFCEVFNEPSPDLSCERREASTITPQVFSLFNGRASYDRALAAAHSVVQTAGEDDAAAVQEIYRRTLNRSANDAELHGALEHWHRMTERHRTTAPTVVERPREIVREAIEENTGVKFTFVEILDEYADFVPDLQPADVDARTRGLAELCLVLFNSNEFAYVY